MSSWPMDPGSISFFLVGIKGTGMCALAEVLQARGGLVSGSDVADEFYTDRVLSDLGIPWSVGFEPQGLGPGVEVVIHSAAYDPQKNPQLIEARRRGLPVFEYTRALGELSATMDSSGISGVHGKTTTTAMAGTLVQGLGLGGTVLAGSAVSNFGGRSTLNLGQDFFVAETCEYRRHFLNFHPRRIIVGNVEMDHQDYFRDLEDIHQAFVEFGLRLPPGGKLIYCADDPGACRVARELAGQRPDLGLVDFGFQARGDWRVYDLVQGPGFQSFRIDGLDPGADWPDGFILRIPGTHSVLDATAAMALVSAILADRGRPLDQAGIAAMANALEGFRGSRRRSELVGEAAGVTFIDDYGHHPSAIRTTLAGYRRFYPGRRLVVDFMSHTWSRTKALLPEFAQAFADADLVILHDIYPSARETPDPWMSGERLFAETAACHPAVQYWAGILEGQAEIARLLEPGDVFITMGAGDNWKLGRALWQDRKRQGALL